MNILFIVLIILAAVGVAVFTIYSNFKKEEKQKYYTAAGNIFKEDYLNYVLQNPMEENPEYQKPNDQKIMVYIKSIKTKPKNQFVFDPQKTILIGRDQEKSNIFLNEALVSQQHCCIYSIGFDVYIQNMNSSNGTYVSKGLFNKILLTNQEFVQLNSGDIVKIGTNKFKIILFFYDITVM